MRSSRNPRGTCFAPGNRPASVSFFSRTSRITGRGDCRDSSVAVTSGMAARASFKSSDFVFMFGMLTDDAPHHDALVRFPTTAQSFQAGGGMQDRPGSILRRASPLMLARLGIAAITFAIPMVLARLLLPASYGTFKQAWLLSNTLFLAFRLG